MRTSDDDEQEMHDERIKKIIASRSDERFEARLLECERINDFFGALMKEQGLTPGDVEHAIGLHRGTVSHLIGGNFHPQRDLVLLFFFAVFDLPQWQIDAALMYYEYPRLSSRARVLKLLALRRKEAQRLDAEGPTPEC